MKCDRFLTLSLVLSLGLVFPPSLPAQNPPATTFQPGPWQPVARVNMSRPGRSKLSIKPILTSIMTYRPILIPLPNYYLLVRRQP